MKVSLIIPVCNGGQETSKTILSAAESLQDVDYEIIVVDDGSDDGWTFGLPDEAKLIRMPERQGCSAAKCAGADGATGNVLIFSDAHCRYPDKALAYIAKKATKMGGVVAPKVRILPKNSIYYGAYFRSRQVGVRSEKTQSFRLYRNNEPSLYGSIYAIPRLTYDFIGGWPKLPGRWGQAETSLGLLCWFSEVPITVVETVCDHIDRPDGLRWPYKLTRKDRASNAHFVHAAFLPNTYPTVWRPRIDKVFGNRTAFRSCLDTVEFRQFRDRVESLRLRSEREFVEHALRMEWPDV